VLVIAIPFVFVSGCTMQVIVKPTQRYDFIKREMQVLDYGEGVIETQL
jgi:hypothetical protein|tara:strand:- start:62594 stop:62737 length:144 start_codon:yes stop_codon:yes gene_type:complete